MGRAKERARRKVVDGRNMSMVCEKPQERPGIRWRQIKRDRKV